MNDNVIDDLNISVSTFDSITNQLNYLLDNMSSMSQSEVEDSVLALKSTSNNSKAYFVSILDKLENFKKNGFN